MAYITISNLNRFIKGLDLQELEKIEEPLHNRWKMRLFSNNERKQLLGLREFFLNPKEFSTYKKIEIHDTYKYVFSESQPAYHKNSSCQRLNSSYKNFEIPFQIREKGEVEINRFRVWYKQNINSQDLDVKKVIEKIQISFPYVGEINPKSIEFENQGYAEFANYSLAELENNIDNILRATNEFFHKNDDNQKILGDFQRNTGLAFKEDKILYNFTGLNDTELKKFLKDFHNNYKIPLKQVLREYFRVLYNPELDFEGNLLEELGFKPCRTCYDENGEINVN